MHLSSDLSGYGFVADMAVKSHRAVQDPGELAMLLVLANAAGPVTVLEIGTFAGGTAWAFAQLPSVQRVITVDHDPQPDAAGRLAGCGKRMTQVTGNSRDEQTWDQVRKALDGNLADLLFIDGAHDYHNVRADWKACRPLVSPGGMAAFHDITPHKKQPEVQVHWVWADLAATRFAMTIVANPGQWGGIGIIWV